MMIITCPKCAARLRLPPELPPEDGVKCPRCATNFLLDLDERAIPARATVAGNGAPEARTTGAAAEARSRKVADEIEERPRRRPARRDRARRQSNPTLIVGLAAGGLLLVLLVVGGVLAVVYLRTRPTTAGGTQAQSAYKQHEALAREAVGLMDELVEMLESVKDAETAQVAAKKVNTIGDRLLDMQKREKKLPRLTVAEDQRLKTQFKADQERTTKRVAEASVQAGLACQGEPTLLQAADRLASIGKQLAQQP
jgi:hypothetical protein